MMNRSGNDFLRVILFDVHHKETKIEVRAVGEQGRKLAVGVYGLRILLDSVTFWFVEWLDGRCGRWIVLFRLICGAKHFVENVDWANKKQNITIDSKLEEYLQFKAFLKMFTIAVLALPNRFWGALVWPGTTCISFQKASSKVPSSQSEPWSSMWVADLSASSCDFSMRSTSSNKLVPKTRITLIGQKCSAP